MWQKYSRIWCWYYIIFEVDTIKYEKKIWVQPNVAKVWSNVMLVRPNVIMELTNVRKKKKGNYRMWQKYSHIWCWYYTIFEDGTIKCEKKIRVQPNVAKVRSNVMLVLPNMTMKPTNVRKKKKGNHRMWQKYSHMWCWYCPMWQWNCQMWGKN